MKTWRFFVKLNKYSLFIFLFLILMTLWDSFVMIPTIFANPLTILQHVNLLIYVITILGGLVSAVNVVSRIDNEWIKPQKGGIIVLLFLAAPITVHLYFYRVNRRLDAEKETLR